MTSYSSGWKAGDLGAVRWGPSPGLAVLLSEDPKQEVGVLVRLKGGGDDDVLPWGQLELAAHLP